MRIVCPSCGAAYEVPEDRLVPGRIVRCARCGSDWAPLAAAPASEPEPPRLEERLAPPEPVPPLPEPPPLVAPKEERLVATAAAPERRRGGTALLVAWILSFLVLAAAAWAAYDRREDVIRAWPASERAYAVLGIAPGR